MLKSDESSRGRQDLLGSLYCHLPGLEAGRLINSSLTIREHVRTCRPVGASSDLRFSLLWALGLARMYRQPFLFGDYVACKPVQIKRDRSVKQAHGYPELMCECLLTQSGRPA